MRHGLPSLCCAVSLLLQAAGHAAESALEMIVMDPLALQLSCACVEGTGQRRYDLLATHLEKTIGRTVKLTFDESLALALRRTGGRADIIIGKDAMVRGDAAKAALEIRRLAALTDRRGSTELRGVFLVPRDSDIKTFHDLAGKRISLGPAEDTEAHAAAKALLDAMKLSPGARCHIAGSMDAAALEMSDGRSDAAVVSAFLPALLEGCGKLGKGSSRTLGHTEPVPFIRVFATASVGAELEQKFQAALLGVVQSAELLAALESRGGFVVPDGDPDADWPDWRGADRSGQVSSLPTKLSVPLQPAWTLTLTGPAMAGPAVSGQRVVIPDKSADGMQDVFRCVDAAEGREIWQLRYDAPGEMEYTNAPRATPVIHQGLVYLQGALGHLHCVELATGRVVWMTNIFTAFGAEVLTWGASIAPLIVDDKLIISPGAKDASLVALDRRTGAVLWRTPGNAAAYAAFILAKFDGVQQIIGYDSGSLGGWNPQTGERLWTLVPPDGSDFNVTTPVVVDDGLLLATENNGTRFYRFDGHGKIQATPVMKNDALAPDTCTPVIAGRRVLASAYGELFCLDLDAGLKTLWQHGGEMFHDHCNLIASPERVLLWTANGDLLLLDAQAPSYRVLTQWRPFDEEHPDTFAHPAIAGDRLYLRSSKSLACYPLGK